MRHLPRRTLVAIAALALVSGGCLAGTRVFPVRVDPEAAAARPVAGGPVQGYRSAIDTISALLVAELDLPLPREFAVFVYASRRAYAKGLAEVGRMPPRRAAEIAEYSAGLGQPRRLFINDEAFNGTPRRAWLLVLAHELTHLAQYELSGGRRGRSEQWLREGMADWVACRVLERLGEGTFAHEKDRAKQAVAGELGALSSRRVDLAELGRPRGWEARHLRSGESLTYRLAFLLTDDLVRQRGFDPLLAYFRAFAESDDRFGHFERVFGVSLGAFQDRALLRLQGELAEFAGGRPQQPPEQPSAPALLPPGAR